MKKRILLLLTALLLVSVLAFTLVACNNEEEQPQEPQPQEQPTVDCNGNHQFGAWTAVAGTDTHERVCSVCSHKETANHNWQKDTAQSIASTHAQAGKDVFVCSDCNAIKEVPTQKLDGHTYDTPTYDWDGLTCTATALCSGCQDEVVESVTVTEQDFHEVTPASCTAKQTGYYVASFTNALFTQQTSETMEVGKKLAHTFTEGVCVCGLHEVKVVVEDYATAHSWGSATSQGQLTMAINDFINANVITGNSNSGKYYTDWRLYQTDGTSLQIVIDGERVLQGVSIKYNISNGGTLKVGETVVASQALHSATDKVITLTVGNTGTATNGQVKITEIAVYYTDVTACQDAHTYGEWATITESTCTEQGTKYHVCSVCGHSETEALELAPHDYYTTWTTDESKHWHECRDCGAKKDESAHSYDQTTHKCDCGKIDPTYKTSVQEVLTIASGFATPEEGKYTTNKEEYNVIGIYKYENGHYLFQGEQKVQIYGTLSFGEGVTVHDGDQIVVFASISRYTDKVVVYCVSGSQATISERASVSITVNSAHATVSGIPAEDIHNGDQITITVTANEGFDISYVKVNGGLVELSATGEYAFEVSGNTNIEVATSVHGLEVQSGSFEKITNVADLADGAQYIIVCESENVMMDTALASLDVAKNNKAVTIANSKIADDGVLILSAITLEKNGDNWSIKCANGKYISRAAKSNGIDITATAVVVTITFDDNGNVNIAGADGTNLRYNKSSGQERFRFFTSAQTAIQLYKYVEPTCPHAFVDSVPTFAWDNTDGIKATLTGICDECGETASFVATVTEKSRTNPTCVAVGSVTYTATVTVNGKEFTEENTYEIAIDTTAHTMVYDNSVELSWDFETNKVTITLKCSNSGCTHTATEVADVTLESTTSATCMAKGNKHYVATCSDGTQLSTDVEIAIDQNAHNFSQEWTKGETTHWHACANDGCTAKQDEAAHVWGDLQTDTPATEDADGLGHQDCTICGETKDVVIPQLSHVHSYDQTTHICSCGTVDSAVVAQIGTSLTVTENTYYLSLADAIANAQADDTIILRADITGDGFFKVENAIKLDMAQHSITTTKGFDVYANFEIANGTLTTDLWSIWAQDEAIVTIASIAVINGNQSADERSSAITVEKGAQLVVNGTVTSKKNIAIAGNGNTDYGNVAITINEGATVTCENGLGIYMPNTNTLTIAGGTITGTTAVYAKCGTTTITGGKLVAVGAQVAYAHDGDGAVETGDALVVEACDYPGGVPTVVISGGEFVSANANAVAYYQQDSQYNATITISGGTFSSNVNALVNNASYHVTQSDDKFVVSAHGQLVLHEAVAPSCTTAGNVAYYTCPDCDVELVKNDEVYSVVTDVTVSATGHTMDFVDAVASSCTVAGTVAHYHCPVCEGNFEDLDGTIALSSIASAALGHIWERDGAQIEYEFDNVSHWTTCTCGQESEHFAHNDAGNSTCVCGLKVVAQISGYKKVTDVATLKAGDSIIFVASDSAVAMGVYVSGNNIAQVDITKNGDYATIGESVGIYILGGETGAWTFKDKNNNYLYAASSSSNYLKAKNTNDNNTKFSIIIDGGVAIVTCKGQYTRNLLQYNDSSKLFACYGSASQKSVSLYKAETIYVCAHESLSAVDGLANSCTTDGYKSCYKCACGCYFEDENATVAIANYSQWILADGKISAGHVFLDDDWADVVGQEATCTEAGKEFHKCQNCEETEQRDKLPMGHIDENEDNICDRCEISMANITKYTVIISAQNATVTGVEDGDYDENTPITFTVSVADGYKLVSVAQNSTILTADGDTYSFTLTEDVEITVTVEKVVTSATVTYNVASTSTVTTTGTAPSGSSSSYSSTYSSKFQLTSGNSMTLTLNGFEGCKITKITLSMKSNKSSGAGYLTIKNGSVSKDLVGSSSSGVPFNNGHWNGAWSSTDYVNIVKSDDIITVTGDLVIIIGATASSLYCQSFTIEYTPAN